jgi:hypothetical protein
MRQVIQQERQPCATHEGSQGYFQIWLPKLKIRILPSSGTFVLNCIVQVLEHYVNFLSSSLAYHQHHHVRNSPCSLCSVSMLGPQQLL